MNRSFVIGDTHFGHKKVIEFESVKRPFETIEEHDAELVKRWNSVVKKKDTVWHLGDVLFGKGSFEILGQLNGVKKLVMGNHDKYHASEYLKYFSQVVGSTQYKGYLLTHIPIHPSQLFRYKGNIHGHLHSSEIDDVRYICVSAEHINLTPLCLQDVINE